jgi:hypothetical protein
MEMQMLAVNLGNKYTRAALFRLTPSRRPTCRRLYLRPRAGIRRIRQNPDRLYNDILARGRTRFGFRLCEQRQPPPPRPCRDFRQPRQLSTL